MCGCFTEYSNAATTVYNDVMAAIDVSIDVETIHTYIALCLL